MTFEQEARVTELTRLLNSEKHAHNPNRPLWESERYSIVANSVGQQGNYVSYASARDAQKAAGLQEAISEIDNELAKLDGKDNVEGRVNILRGDRQRFTDELAALSGSGVQSGRFDIPAIAKDMRLVIPAEQGNAPDGFDFTVPEKYNAPSAAATVVGLATLATLPSGSVEETIEAAIAAGDKLAVPPEFTEASPEPVPSSDAPADADRNDAPVEETPSQSTDPADDDDDLPF